MLRYVFLFAHPDDETVSCAGTIARLRGLADPHSTGFAAGDEVFLVTVTDGAGGEVSAAAQPALATHHGSIGKLRLAELTAAAAAVGVPQDHVRCLGFADGQITNQDVWGRLTDAMVALYEQLRPDVLVTFDHTGWYFHLDHVATSIAATSALFKAKLPPMVAFHAHYWIPNTQWHYAWPPSMPVTHLVEIGSVLKAKRQALACHLSQTLGDPLRQLDTPGGAQEMFQLVWHTAAGKQWLKTQTLFTSHKSQKIIREGLITVLQPLA